MAIREIRQGVTTWGVEQVAQKLHSPDEGLSLDQVAQRQSVSVSARFPWKSPGQWHFSVLEPVSILLILGGVATLGWGTLGQTAALGGGLLFHWGLGLAIRWRGREAFPKGGVHQNRVRRAGTVRVVATDQLVTGDRVILRTGDRVGADCRLVVTEDLVTRERSLTGVEGVVRKSPQALPHGEYPLTEQSNMVFAGTYIAHGRGEAIVVEVGDATQLAKLARFSPPPKEEPIGLENQLAHTVRLVGLTVVVPLAFWVFLRWFQGQEFFGLALVGLTVVAAMIPDILVDLSLGILRGGARTLRSMGVEVRRLSGLVSLGSVSTLVINDTPGAMSTGVLEREVSLEWTAGQWKESRLGGEALALASSLTSIDGGGDNGEFTTSVHQVLETQVFGETTHIAISRGDWEEIRRHCRTVWGGATGPGVLSLKEVEAVINRWMGLGYRVQAFSFRPLRNLECPEQWQDRHHFLGLIAFSEPLSEEVHSALSWCKNSGVRVVLLSSRPFSAVQNWVSRLALEGDVVSWIEGPGNGKSISSSVSAYAALSPTQKERVLELLRDSGNTTAVVGSEDRDTRLLDRASVGVSGAGGSAWLKGHADLGLTTAGFVPLVNALALARGIRERMARLSEFLLSSKLGALLLILLLSGSGVSVENPALVLWIGLVAIGVPAFLLGGLGGAGELAWSGGEDLLRIGWLGAATVAVGGYWVFRGVELGHTAGEIQAGLWFTLALSFLVTAWVLGGLVRNSVLWRWSLGTGILLVVYIVALNHRTGRALLGTDPLPFWEALVCVGLALLPGVGEWVRSAFLRQPFSQRVSGG